ncbi:immunity protein YezG family protein [Fredinandcohnia salidurans]|uniref:Immunity protein YezG family protein n=1 Tax=Fredinandcohnia salidurans TaxID=2595041 RepID=A0ABW4MYS9_9BACI
METKKMEQLYQEIANILAKIVPQEWKKILLYAEYREGNKNVFFYLVNQKGLSYFYFCSSSLLLVQ